MRRIFVPSQTHFELLETQNDSRSGDLEAYSHMMRRRGCTVLAPEGAVKKIVSHGCLFEK